MSTVRDLVSGSLRLLGVLASGEAPSANEASDAFSALNDMVGSWSTESLLIYAKTNETFSLTASQQSYTWGSGGNFNSARPLKIENAAIRTTSGGTVYDLQLKVLTLDQWNAIGVKNVTSTLSTAVYMNNDYPLATVYFWPIPTDASKTFYVWSWKAISSFASLDSTVDFPPGYAKALRYNLALELAPEFKVPLDDLIVQEALASKASIKRMNQKPQLLGIDEALVATKPAWNWLTGE